jgi:hypothetical protein
LDELMQRLAKTKFQVAMMVVLVRLCSRVFVIGVEQMAKSPTFKDQAEQPNFLQTISNFAIVPSPNSAVFIFETNRPCQPGIDVFPLATANEALDMADAKVITGNVFDNIATPAGTRHVFRVPRRPIQGKPGEGAQLAMGTRFRFRVIAPPDAQAVAHGFTDVAVIKGEFSTGFRNGSAQVQDLNVFRAGDPHKFGLTVGAYRDSDNRLLDKLADVFTTNDSPVNFDNSNASFQLPFGNRPLHLGQCSDKLQFYSMGFGPNRKFGAPFRPSDFVDAPPIWPGTADHGEDDSGPWATAVGSVDLPDWGTPGVDPVSFTGALANAATLAAQPKKSFQTTIPFSLDCGNFGVHYQIDLSIRVTVAPPAFPPSIDAPKEASAGSAVLKNRVGRP